MLDLLASVHRLVVEGIFRAVATLGSFHIKERSGSFALDTFFAIEVGTDQGAIGDIVILPAPLVVLVHDIVDALPAQDPVSGIEVGLEDSGGQHR